jgi:predicted ArsR family transcriptional regulator
VKAAVTVLSALGGAADFQPEGNSYLIRGYGCPLAVAAGQQKLTCVAVESFLSAYLSAPVSARCEENGRRHCLFEVRNGA